MSLSSSTDVSQWFNICVVSQAIMFTNSRPFQHSICLTLAVNTVFILSPVWQRTNCDSQERDRWWRCMRRIYLLLWLADTKFTTPFCGIQHSLKTSVGFWTTVHSSFNTEQFICISCRLFTPNVSFIINGRIIIGSGCFRMNQSCRMHFYLKLHAIFVKMPLWMLTFPLKKVMETKNIIRCMNYN